MNRKVLAISVALILNTPLSVSALSIVQPGSEPNNRGGLPGVGLCGTAICTDGNGGENDFSGNSDRFSGYATELIYPTNAVGGKFSIDGPDLLSSVWGAFTAGGGGLPPWVTLVKRKNGTSCTSNCGTGTGGSGSGGNSTGGSGSGGNSTGGSGSGGNSTGGSSTGGSGSGGNSTGGSSSGGNSTGGSSSGGNSTGGSSSGGSSTGGSNPNNMDKVLDAVDKALDRLRMELGGSYHSDESITPATETTTSIDENGNPVTTETTGEGKKDVRTFSFSFSIGGKEERRALEFSYGIGHRNLIFQMDGSNPWHYIRRPSLAESGYSFDVTKGNYFKTSNDEFKFYESTHMENASSTFTFSGNKFALSDEIGERYGAFEMTIFDLANSSQMKLIDVMSDPIIGGQISFLPIGVIYSEELIFNKLDSLNTSEERKRFSKEMMAVNLAWLSSLDGFSDITLYDFINDPLVGDNFKKMRLYQLADANVIDEISRKGCVYIKSIDYEVCPN
ncbi:hypothetical protein L4C37_13215 [Vibrio kagoshimensis]|uniref:hypothetical protein n=1 Tax=Vibrio kagoshimensis TaxID=2910244 RepID=UPI003D1CC1AB